MSLRSSTGRFFQSRWWRVGRFFAGLALAGAALYVLNGQKGELVGASNDLAKVRIVWLLLAIVAEILSYVSFGALQRRLLRSGGVETTTVAMTGVSLAAGAIANSMPGGTAFSSVYAFRQYRRRGADEALAGWTVLAALVCEALGLGLLATAGVLLAVQQSSAYGLVGVIFGVLVVSAVADAVVFQRRWLAHVTTHLLGVTRRLTGRPRRQAVEVVDSLLERLSSVKLGWHEALTTVGFGIGNWSLDCACLALSFIAVGAPVPWRGLLLAYGAGQLAANLPVTPGGLGVVEGSLTVAIVAFGGAELSTVAAVLVYRIVSFWGYLPVGWGVWAMTTLRHRRADRRADAELLHPAGRARTGPRSGPSATTAWAGPVAPLIEPVRRDGEQAVSG